MSRHTHLGVKLIKLLITIYRYSLSLIIGRQCRYAPSCSEFTAEAVEKFGVLKGSYLGIRRIGRCRPGGRPKGGAKDSDGYDPVPETFSWK